MILMACKTSGDSSRRVPGIIFREIQDSFTTQGLASKAPRDRFLRDGRPRARQPGPAEIEAGTTCESLSTHDNQPAGGTT
jgi:hypothetical protein